MKVKQAVIHLRTALMLLEGEKGKPCADCGTPFAPKAWEARYSLCGRCWVE